MKCLRCGRVMKEGETECECGHFYDDNLHENKKSFIKNKKSITLVEILAIILILAIMILIAASYVISSNNRKNNNNYESNNCNIKCEGSSYSIRNNKCICSNGEEYPIE